MLGKGRFQSGAIPTTLLTLASDFYHRSEKKPQMSNVIVQSGKSHFPAKRPPAFLCRNSKTVFHYKTKGGQYVTHQMEPGNNFFPLDFPLDGRFF